VGARCPAGRRSRHRGAPGKIVLDTDADWHLFMGDITCLGSAYRMAQSVEAPGRVVFVVETDHCDDAFNDDVR